ncbi:Deoxyuridine 5'-triphosphate nucleotidohydrolase [Pedobacter sp. Bi27]|uniref:dUTP diphosphatase n=1 Tax=unclassified Pedobacter TaxID=2628915 RepID=UPI001DE30CC4|nr:MULTISPECIES: dUTP diphosphatase [unclassified Pedobacter]CAH0215496.1 Deoxyuridine 5'-triphosphate nucleotidohydrolase [Pedobacter sp. Bi27]CAH0255727.1 Deoxyuridine 5'-triphosphate nucleotidohydrolase [Pedobacter sp. Bi126]CAH0314317.1 Deoxyuridine 5'-triphosphate nucleotidohydrolase [Pedobacter sp. Bi36]
MEIKIINTSEHPLPQYETAHAAGMDLRASIIEEMILKPLQRLLVPTGLFIELPIGYEAQIRPRSGLAYKHGISIVNAPGTIDADYRGEIKVLLVNLSDTDFKIVNGDRIAQMVVAKHETVSWHTVEQLGETARGEGGYGHTGK